MEKKCAPIASVHKRHVRVDIRPTSPTPRNNGIRDHRDLQISLLHRSVRREDEGKRHLALRKQTARRRDRIERAALITWVRIRVRRVAHARAWGEADLGRRAVQLERLRRHREQVLRVQLERLLAHPALEAHLPELARELVDARAGLLLAVLRRARAAEVPLLLVRGGRAGGEVGGAALLLSELVLGREAGREELGGLSLGLRLEFCTGAVGERLLALSSSVVRLGLAGGVLAFLAMGRRR